MTPVSGTKNGVKSAATAIVVAPPRVRVVAASAVAEPSVILPRQDEDNFNGTRKLIRPHLPQVTERRPAPATHTDDPLTHALLSDHHGAVESSHAEAFYFQKQMQQQTEMTVVLEDGEQLHGIIQWYDRSVVKLRVGRNRVLVYKSGIKYLYKASEDHPDAGVMK